MRRVFGASIALTLMAVTACTPAGDNNGGPTPLPQGDVVVINTEGFEIPPFSEFYQCWRVNIEGLNRGVTEISYEPGSDGVHHVIMATDTSPDPEGTAECDLIEIDWQVMFAGGVESDPLYVPDGVAFPLGNGTKQIVFQIHYFNPLSEPIIDNTEIHIQLTKENADFIDAGLLVTGNFGFEIPPFATEYNVWGSCNSPNFGEPANIFAVFPHMHQFGTHISMGITDFDTGEETMLFDEPWAFGEQPIRAIKHTFEMRDVLDVECEYNNPTGQAIDFGESTTEEMCFGFYFFYPSPSSQVIPCFSDEGESL